MISLNSQNSHIILKKFYLEFSQNEDLQAFIFRTKLFKEAFSQLDYFPNKRLELFYSLFKHFKTLRLELNCKTKSAQNLSAF